MGYVILNRLISLINKTLKMSFFLQENIHFHNLSWVLDQWRPKKRTSLKEDSNWIDILKPLSMMFSPNFFIRNASRGKLELFEFCICHLCQVHLYNPTVSANKHFKIDKSNWQKSSFSPVCTNTKLKKLQITPGSGFLTKKSRENVFVWGQDEHWARGGG